MDIIFVFIGKIDSVGLMVTARVGAGEGMTVGEVVIYHGLTVPIEGTVRTIECDLRGRVIHLRKIDWRAELGHGIDIRV